MMRSLQHGGILLDAETIASRIKVLASEIAADFKGKHVTALVVLKGSFVFASDLLRSIDLPLDVEFIGLRSYGSRTASSGVVEITLDVQQPLRDKHILVIEDIIDTGLTADYLKDYLATRKPASVKICSLLHKPSRTIKEVPIDYVGFEVPDEFVIGYGLDFDGLYRNLPHIAILESSKDS